MPRKLLTEEQKKENLKTTKAKYRNSEKGHREHRIWSFVDLNQLIIVNV